MFYINKNYPKLFFIYNDEEIKCFKWWNSSLIKKNLINRLSRIAGQVKGISNMVENDSYCIEILNQVSAVKKALDSFSLKLLETHMDTCVRKKIKADDEYVVQELISTIERRLWKGNITSQEWVALPVSQE